MAEATPQGGAPTPAAKPVVPAVKPVDTKVTPPVDEPKYKLTVKGAEIELPLSEVLKRAQKAEGAEKMFEEATKLRREAEAKSLSGDQLLAKLKADPKGFIRQMDKLGLDHRKIISDILMEHIEEARLTPEEKAQREKDRKLSEYEDREKTAKEREDSAKLTQAVHTRMVAMAKEVNEQIVAAGLPADKETRARVMYFMKVAIDRGGVIPVAKAVEFAKRSRIAELRSVIENLPDDKMGDYVSEDFLKKLRKLDLDNFKGKNPLRAPSTTKREGAKPIDKKMTMDEWKAKRKAQMG